MYIILTKVKWKVVYYCGTQHHNLSINECCSKVISLTEAMELNPDLAPHGQLIIATAVSKLGGKFIAYLIFIKQ